MKITPISETVAHTQANAFRVWPRGIYYFEVAEALEKTSKAGNAMVELTLRVLNDQGQTRKIMDWLVETEATGYKTRHFAQAAGMLPEYERGEMHAADMVGRTGRCELRIKKGEKRDDGEAFPDKNSISDYLPPKSADAMERQAPGQPAAPAAAPFDDEIPF